VSSAAELSSLATSVAELEQRVTRLAAGLEGANHDDALAALYDAERSLRAARRSVERAATLLR
jgi:hypothetical protein